MGRGKDKFTKQARLSPETVTKASEGRVPRLKRKQRNSSNSKSSAVETTKVNPAAMKAAKSIQKQNPGSRVVVNRDGSVEVRNK